MKWDVDTLDLLRRVLAELEEHDAEYHHRTNPSVLADLKDTIAAADRQIEDSKFDDGSDAAGW